MLTTWFCIDSDTMKVGLPHSMHVTNIWLLGDAQIKNFFYIIFLIILKTNTFLFKTHFNEIIDM